MLAFKANCHPNKSEQWKWTRVMLNYFSENNKSLDPCVLYVCMWVLILNITKKQTYTHSHIFLSSSRFQNKIIQIFNLLLLFFLFRFFLHTLDWTLHAYVNVLDGKFILELARSKESDRGWISVERKTYWPSAALSQTSSITNHKIESSTSLSCKYTSKILVILHSELWNKTTTLSLK